MCIRPHDLIIEKRSGGVFIILEVNHGTDAHAQRTGKLKNIQFSHKKLVPRLDINLNGRPHDYRPHDY